MKKILNFVLCIAAAACLVSSCDNLLKPESPSSYETSAVYSNYTLAENAIFGISHAFGIDKSYRNRLLAWYGFNTDIEWYNTYNLGNDNDKSEIGVYDCLPDNSQLNEAEGIFTIMYTAIERANLAIEGLREYGNVKEKDDMLKELSNKARTDAFMAMFWTVIIGELLYGLVIDKAYFLWAFSYIAIWFPVAIYISIHLFTEGLLIFGSRKKEESTKKSLAIRTFIGSLFFGAFVGFEFYFHDGAFDPKGLIAVLLLAAGWGIPFYLMFRGFMKLSEKKADKNLEKEN